MKPDAYNKEPLYGQRAIIVAIMNKKKDQATDRTRTKIFDVIIGAVDAIVGVVGVLFLGGFIVFFVGAGGEFINKYVYNKPLWEIWIVYLVVGGFAYYLYKEVVEGKFK